MGRPKQNRAPPVRTLQRGKFVIKSEQNYFVEIKISLEHETRRFGLLILHNALTLFIDYNSLIIGEKILTSFHVKLASVILGIILDWIVF